MAHIPDNQDFEQLPPACRIATISGSQSDLAFEDQEEPLLISEDEPLLISEPEDDLDGAELAEKLEKTTLASQVKIKEEYSF